MRRSIGLILAATCMLSLSGARAAQSSQTMADVWRTAMIEAAEREGLDPQTLLDAETDVTTSHRDGRVTVTRMTIGEAIQRIGEVLPALRFTEPGLGGGPEITVGDVAHAYLNTGILIDPSYAVATSTVVPATPPIYDAMPTFYESGGPLRQVKGKDWDFGAHGVGTTIGSNVDTGQGGPYLPVASSGIVTDSSIDFIGHADVTQFGECFFVFCFWFGFMTGSGVALFDNESGVDIPLVP